jgi:hypothetical protein
MYHIINPNCLYDIINETRIELNLYKGKDKNDVAKFLDDVSIWMDKNREYISDNYLPFCVLSVGIIPIQVSAFMYGLFVGKALEKHGAKIKTNITKVDKDTIMREIEKNINYYNGLLGDNLKDNFKENNDERGTENAGV